jgi:hypothetical protein
MAFFESKKGFWLMFAIFLGIALLTVTLRIENFMNFWNKISGVSSSLRIK